MKNNDGWYASNIAQLGDCQPFADDLQWLTMINNQLQDNYNDLQAGLQWFTSWFTMIYKLVYKHLQSITINYKVIYNHLQSFTIIYNHSQ